MPSSVNYSVASLRGREALNLADNKGKFALNESLKPKLFCATPLKVAVPKNFGDTHVLAAALLSWVAHRKMDFVFISGDDPTYCEADFVMLPLSPIWGDDNDVWEVMLGILANTPWVLELFHIETAAEDFFRTVWSESYDGIFDIIMLNRMQGKPQEDAMMDAIKYTRNRIRTVYLRHRERGAILVELMEATMHHMPKAVVCPPRALFLGSRIVREWVAYVRVKQNIEEPLYTVVAPNTGDKSWRIYPALYLGADGEYNEVPGIREQFNNPSIKLAGVVYKDYISCPNQNAAFAVSQWLIDQKDGRTVSLKEYYKGKL